MAKIISGQRRFINRRFGRFAIITEAEFVYRCIRLHHLWHWVHTVLQAVNPHICMQSEDGSMFQRLKLKGWKVHKKLHGQELLWIRVYIRRQVHCAGQRPKNSSVTCDVWATDDVGYLPTYGPVQRNGQAEVHRDTKPPLYNVKHSCTPASRRLNAVLLKQRLCHRP